jgi:hypothetical protein
VLKFTLKCLFWNWKLKLAEELEELLELVITGPQPPHTPVV